MDMLSPESGLDLLDESWPIYARTFSAPAAFLGENALVTHSAFNRGSELYGRIENSVLAQNVFVGEGAVVSYSVLLPGVRVEAGAVVQYAILGENCRVGENSRIGAAPESTSPEQWGLAVLAPDCEVAGGRVVLPKTMLDKNGKEVATK
jgi:glucose-1-phosphate adenylyltransferase